VSIDNLPPSFFIATRGTYTSNLHDPDARYNHHLRSPASNFWIFPQPDEVAFDLENGGILDDTEVGFANGTIQKYKNYAILNANFSKITSPDDVHQIFEVDRYKDKYWLSYHLARESLDFLTVLKEPEYPEASIEDKTCRSAGWVFDSGDLSDVSVLAIHAFEEGQETDLARRALPERASSHEARSMESLLGTVKGLISMATDSGKKRLIIDLRNNYGMDSVTALATYFILFPGSHSPWVFRARANDQLKWLGNGLIERIKSSGRSSGSKHISWPFWVGDNAVAKQYADFDEFFGPDVILGDNFTKASVVYSNDYIKDLRGTLPRDTPPFKPEDIVILTDGVCYSGCALFVGALTRGHGVRTVALGGRPLIGPMQAVGGSKAGPLLTMGYLEDVGDIVSQVRPRPVNVSFFGVKPEDAPLQGGTQWAPGFDVSINGGNAYTEEKMDGLPLQFSTKRLTVSSFTLGTCWRTQRPRGRRSRTSPGMAPSASRDRRRGRKIGLETKLWDIPTR